MQLSTSILLSCCIFAAHLAGSMCLQEMTLSSERPVFGRKKCVSVKANTLVFRSQASRNISGYYQLIMQPVTTKPDDQLLSEVHTWTFRKGKAGDFRMQTLPLNDVNAIKVAFKFQLLGWTEKKHVERYKRRETRLRYKCRSLCFRKLQRIEKGLKLKAVAESNRCRVKKQIEILF